jgi:transposase
MKISCDEATGIPLKSWERTVNRGLARRMSRLIEDLAVDETSFQKRHEYVTVLTDRNSGAIMEILDDQK